MNAETMTVTSTDVQKLNGVDLGAALAAAGINPATTGATANPLDALMAEIERLKGENRALAAKAGQSVVNNLTLRVSEKGALSIYGLGRFPFTGYKEQWRRILGMAAEIEAFIVANDKVLKNKGDK